MTKLNMLAQSAAARWQARNTEEGQGLAEYGLILALIAVVCIGALTTMGTNITTKLGSLNASL